MDSKILEKKQQLLHCSQVSKKMKYQLLDIVRNTPEYFIQFLSHIGQQKIQEFLEKEPKYKMSKVNVQKIQEQIEDLELKQRQMLLNYTNLPQTFKRACLSTVCAICLNKHQFTEVMVLSCGHVFHGKCVQKLKNYECPMCRSQILCPKSQHSYFGSRRSHEDD